MAMANRQSAMAKYESRYSDTLLALVESGISDTMAKCEWTDAMANAWAEQRGVCSVGGAEMTRLVALLLRCWPVKSYWTNY